MNLMTSIHEKLYSTTTTANKLTFLREAYHPIDLNIGPIKRLDDYNEFGRYYQTPEGHFPSVTTALGSVTDKSFLVQWRNKVGDAEANRISRMALNYGNRVHETIENSALGKSVKLPVHYRNIPNLIHKTLHGRISNIALIEQFLYSKSIKLAGTVDCFAKWDGEWAIVDWKTSRNEKKREWIDHYFIQAFFYACMIKECLNIQVKKLVIPVFYLDQTDSDVFVEDVQTVMPKALQTYQQIKQVMNL